MENNNTKSVFEQVREKSEPWIKHYIEDLTLRDKEAIEGNPNIPFLHFTRENGTQIVFLIPADHASWPQKGEQAPYLFGQADRDHILNEKKSVVNYCLDDQITHCILHYSRYCFEWKVNELNPKHARQIIENYVTEVKREWNNLEIKSRFGTPERLASYMARK